MCRNVSARIIYLFGVKFTGSLCTATNFLVSGPYPVPNDKMTASSSYYDADAGGYHGASEARLNNTRVTYANGSYTAGIWAAGAADLNQYIQVALFTVIVN